MLPISLIQAPTILFKPTCFTQVKYSVIASKKILFINCISIAKYGCDFRYFFFQIYHFCNPQGDHWFWKKFLQVLKLL